jgi:alanyl-tRNA synthetase
VHPNDLRASFLRYFERHGHRIVASAPLVPGDDPTLLFTNAGMNQFKDVFLGREARDYRRATTSQKCMRVSGKHNDLDNVGPSLRHHTFFEMLGNFSFGDYFKQDAIELAWSLLTKEWGLDPSKLYATVFKGENGIPRDDEAYARWREFLPADHVGELGMADNFWAMGDTGPCGRCSEIYYDRGAGLPGTGQFIPDVEGGSERFVEIWNNVFMEFERDAQGSLTPLPAPSIDTGMGLERISAVMQGVLSNYDTPLFMPILEATGRLAGRTYGRTMEPADISMRVIADHLRAMTFLIADGVVPSNEWRGYVLRKIMRRAMRHGRKLGLHEPFLHSLVDVLVGQMGNAYPELKAGREAVVQVVRAEEERFDAVLTGGLPRLEEALERAARGSRMLPGDEAFKLYDTYGLPRDFIEDLASNQGLQFDAEGFAREMEGQRVKARAGSGFKSAAPDGFTLPPAPGDRSTAVMAAAGREFTGYEETRHDGSTVLMIWDQHQQSADREGLKAGDTGFVVLDKTPFYVEAGGQVSDRGQLSGAGFAASVVGVVKSPGMPRIHKVDVTLGTLKAGDTVVAEVDAALRDATRRNHTGTHLLHSALRQVLGPHVKQAGSLVAPDRLRFDFVHFSAVSAADLRRIEDLVNEAILRNETVTTAVRDTQEAIAAGAMALFGEKYGDKVRVVSIGDGAFSTELCGGTHVRATGDIGPFLILEETGVAAGVRRIEALTGLAALDYARPRLREFERVRAILNAGADDVAARLEARLQTLEKAIKDRDRKLAAAAAGDSGGSGQRLTIGDVTLVYRRVDDANKDLLRSIADQIKSTLTSGVVFLAGPTADGKVAMVASVTGNVSGRLKAGQLVKELAPIVNGGGGGRPDFAEAGGKDPAQVDAMLAAAPEVVQRLLGV